MPRTTVNNGHSHTFLVGDMRTSRNRGLSGKNHSHTLSVLGNETSFNDGHSHFIGDF